MTDLARLYAQIALLKRGPQDLPASTRLLAITVLGYFTINLVVSLALPGDSGPWLAVLVVDVLFTLAWYVALLQLSRRPERMLQTTTAVFGYRAVLTPISIVSTWLVRRFGEDATWLLPASVAYTVVLVWMIVVNGHVLKAALEFSALYCYALVILEILTGQLVLLALVPLPR